MSTNRGGPWMSLARVPVVGALILVSLLAACGTTTEPGPRQSLSGSQSRGLSAPSSTPGVLVALAFPVLLILGTLARLGITVWRYGGKTNVVTCVTSGGKISNGWVR